VHRALDSVKGRLEREKNDAAAKAANPFLHRFQGDAVVYLKIETIGPSTSIPELDTLATITPQELAGMQDRVEALQPRSVETRLQIATSDRDIYGNVLAAAQVAEAFAWGEHNAAVENARKADEAYAKATKTAFAGEEIPGLFGDAWRDFIAAGETYLRDTGAGGQPNAGDACPYCRQELGAKALALVRKYHYFSNNEPKRALDVATQAVTRLAAKITSLSVATVNDACKRRRSGFPDAGPSRRRSRVRSPSSTASSSAGRRSLPPAGRRDGRAPGRRHGAGARHGCGGCEGRRDDHPAPEAGGRSEAGARERDGEAARP